jgi:oligopeptide transport system ATP-binding protein
MGKPLVSARGIKVYFPVKGKFLKSDGDMVVKAVDGLNIEIQNVEIHGLVGESGCGKSTLGRTLLKLIKLTDGEVYYKGKNITEMKEREIRRLRKDMGIIFQDPYASLNPAMTVEQIVEEPLKIHHSASVRERKKKVKQTLEVVGLSPRFSNWYPHEFSGGQRQRIGIARALVLNPTFVVADEPVSSLDVSIQAQIINLLFELQERFKLTYLFISHDLSVVRHISNRISVMYLGKIIELADNDELYEHPLHPYAKALLSAVPIPDPEKEAKRKRIILRGDVPSSTEVPPGCRFHPRCWERMEICDKVSPEWLEIRKGHWVACHLYYDHYKMFSKGG